MQNLTLFIAACVSCFFSGTAFGMALAELDVIRRRLRR